MKKLVGLFASVALMTSGAALAFEGQQDDVSGSSMQSGQGGSGQQGSGATGSQPGSMGQGSGSQQQGQMGTSGSQDMGSQLGGAQAQAGNSVSGKVVSASRKSVFLQQQDGAVVQLKVDNKTQINLPGAKKASELTEGQEIRASFEVKGTSNHALSIDSAEGAGMGGSGGVLLPDSGINQQGGSMGNDTGGSGNIDPGGSMGNDTGALGDDTGGAGNMDPGSGSDIGSDVSQPGGDQQH